MRTITLTEKQSQIITNTANECFAGGSASGGKTFVNKVIAIMVAEQVPGAQVAILRNTSKNLKKNYLQGSMSMQELLGDHIKSGLVSINYSDMTIVWKKTGSVIHMMHAEHVESTIDNLTGIEFALVVVDEASRIDSKIIKHAFTRLRLGSLQVENEFWKHRLPKMVLSSNPSGISHQFLKERYIDPAPAGTPFLSEFGKTLLFIPFGARENPHVDYEAYEKELLSTGDMVKYKQLALGDWSAGESNFFNGAFVRRYNVLPTFKVPSSWRVYRGYDDGRSSPFCVLWKAEVVGENLVTVDGRDYYFPNGTEVVVDEWYGFDGVDRSRGLGMDPIEIAKGIIKREEQANYGSRVRPGPADNAIDANITGGNTVAQEMRRLGVSFTRSDKSKGSRIRGWGIIKDKLRRAHVDAKLEQPALFIMQHCHHLITDLESAPTSDKDSDDIDTSSVDHTLDALRYMVSTKVPSAGRVSTTGL